MNMRRLWRRLTLRIMNMFFPVKTELQSESLHELQFISYCRPDKDQHAGFVLTLRETLFYVFLMFHSAAVTQHPSSHSETQIWCSHVDDEPFILWNMCVTPLPADKTHISTVMAVNVGLLSAAQWLEQPWLIIRDRVRYLPSSWATPPLVRELSDPAETHSCPLITTCCSEPDSRGREEREGGVRRGR